MQEFQTRHCWCPSDRHSSPIWSSPRYRWPSFQILKLTFSCSEELVAQVDLCGRSFSWCSSTPFRELHLPLKVGWSWTILRFALDASCLETPHRLSHFTPPVLVAPSFLLPLAERVVRSPCLVWSWLHLSFWEPLSCCHSRLSRWLHLH